MLAESKYKPGDGIWKTKEKVYGDILQYLDTEGYPIDVDSDFNEANVSDLVLYIVGPILSSFKRKTGRDVFLRREKETISTKEEFVVVDLVSVAEEKFVLIVKVKGSSLGLFERQCLLAIKDMGDNNGGGEVYGFITTGESWQMFKYDGVSFWKTERMDAVFDTMDEDKEKWMKDYSILVDCIYVALSRGGIAKKDVVVSVALVVLKLHHFPTPWAHTCMHLKKHYKINNMNSVPWASQMTAHRFGLLGVYKPGIT